MDIQTWFYAAADRQQHGPFSTEELMTLFRSGKIALTTPVWREGEPERRPLADFSGELNLADTSGVAPSSPPPLSQAAAKLPVNGVPAAGPPRKKLSGCAIAAIVAIVIVALAIPVLVILAAVALPAYQQHQDFSVRIKASEVLLRASGAKMAVVEFFHENERCPADNDERMRVLLGGWDTAATALHFDEEDGRCVIEMTIQASKPSQLEGKVIRLDFDPEATQWGCRSDIDDLFLPSSCRG
ncbi:MAG: pilin [Xanthomonadaceae bacterium]|jgi:type IV pilus assembly protein PilA|nr:pilin [Xanthomonadaceae bacterium]